MTEGAVAERKVRLDWSRPSLLLALACVAIHLVANSRYGVFRDELYFIVCGQHPAFGYVDQPPLTPLIAAASYRLFGTALPLFRLAPMLAMAATVALTAEFARILGGGRFAQGLAGLCVLLGGVFLVDGVLVSTDMIQPLTWLGCAWCLVRLAQTGNERWWLGFGAIAGVSLESKYLIGFYLVGLAAGILATPLRRSLTKPWLYLGAALALAIAAPSIVWQALHGFAFLELGKAGASGKNLQLSPLAFFAQQLLFVGPAAAPVWLIGLWRFSIRPANPAYRALPIAYAVTAALFIALHGKAYYLAAAYPALLAGGAVAIEGWLTRPAPRAAVIAAVALVGAALAPLAAPLLPPPAFIRYASALRLTPAASATEHQRLGALPQQFADMFGWPEMAAQVAAVYRGLPPADRARAVFFGWNYGEAAAIDIYGRPLGLPPAISGHNNYYLWGPRGHDGSVVIMVGGDIAQLPKAFGSITTAGRIDSPYAMPFETNLPIYVLRQPRLPLAQLWPRLKHYE
jgi:hypothetical protein